MRFLSKVLVAAELVSCAYAAGKGYVNLDLNVIKGQDVNDALHKAGLFKRGEAVVNLVNEISFYLVNITVGSPGQDLGVLIDTGSSDLWVVGSGAPDCMSNGGSMDCTVYGTFAPENSSTYHNNHTDFEIAYADNSSCTGLWGSDIVSFGGATLQHAPIAVANETNTPLAVMGIGYEYLESTDDIYTNIPYLMKQEGLINKVAYSIYMDSPDAMNGVLLFGGIDVARFEGNLSTFPMQKSGHEYVFEEAILNSVSIETEDFDCELTMNSSFILDTGSTYCGFEEAYIDIIIDAIDPMATYNETEDTFYTNCSLMNSGRSMSFTFGDKVIATPFTDLIQSVDTDEDGNDICAIAIAKYDGATNLLGDSFLRSAYVVFNLEDETVSLAQAKYTTESNIEPIL